MADLGGYARLRQLASEDPEEFRRLMAMAFEKNVVPHASQQVVLDSQARFKIMNCGRRWGKTVLAAKIIVSKSRKKNQMLWWVAPTYRIVKRGYAEVIRQLPAGVLAKPAPPDSNFDAGRAVILHFKNGTVMEFYSAERPEGMLGAAVDYCVMDEASRMKPATWQQTISPTLIDHEGGALMISTPKGRNWFYYEWLKGQDPQQPLYDSWTFTTQDNPTLPPGEADRMAASMPKMEADQEIFAKFIAAGSSVFILQDHALQDAAVHRSGLIEGQDVTNAHVMLGIDLARTSDYTVIMGERENGENVYYERMQAIAWEEQRRRIRRAVSVLHRAGAAAVTLVVDEGNAGSVIVEDLEDAGYDVVGINFTTHKANMVRLLANDLERGRAKVLNSPEYGLTEFENYEMGITPGGRYTYSAPEGQHDDVVSAKMLAHHGTVNEGVSGGVITVSVDEPVPSREDLPQSDDLDAWGDMEEYEDGAFDDLLDEDPDLDDPRKAAEAIGLVVVDLTRPPSAQELMLQDDLWH
jgi:hypothetical protein